MQHFFTTVTPVENRLTTPRLILRQWQQSDFSPFAALNADAEGMAYFPATLTREESDALATRCMQRIKERGWGLWAVELRGSGGFIGFVGLDTPSAALPFSPCVEVGWRLARQYWGQGYATEAAQKALYFGFEQLNLAQIVSFTAMQNVRSQAVMQRLGMHNTNTPFQHPLLPPEHPLSTHCLYTLGAEQFRKAVRQRMVK